MVMKRLAKSTNLQLGSTARQTADKLLLHEAASGFLAPRTRKERAGADREVIGRKVGTEFEVNAMMSTRTKDIVVQKMATCWSWSKVDVFVNKLVDFAGRHHRYTCSEHARATRTQL